MKEESRAVARLERAMPRVVIDPAVPDRVSLDNEIARLRGHDIGELPAAPGVRELLTYGSSGRATRKPIV